MNVTKLIFVLGLLATFSSVATAQNRELYLQLKPKVVEKAFNAALKRLSGNDDNFLVMRFKNFSQSIPVKLENTRNLRDVDHYGRQILNLNITGHNNVKFTLESPYFQGKIKFLAPKVISQDNGRTFNVEFNAEIENYYIYFRRIWFGEKGFTNMSQGDHKSCMNQVLDGTYTYGKPEVIAKWKKDIQNFYFRTNRRPYNRFKGSIWARVEHMSVGYGDENASYRDDRNIIKMKIRAKVNMGKNDTTLSVTSIETNLGKRGGARLPLKLQGNWIKIPPIFIKTQAHRIDQDGNYIDNDPNGRWEDRCTMVQLGPLKEYAASMARGLARKLPAILDKKISGEVFDKLNKLTEELSIPSVPRELSYSGTRQRQTTTQRVGNQTVEVPRTTTASFEDNMANIIGDFMTYRAGVGFKDIKTSPAGDAITVGIDSILEIDGQELVYREPRQSRSGYDRPFNFDANAGHDVSFAVSGKLFNKIADTIKTRFLKAKLPDAVNVYIPHEVIKIDNYGNMVLKPRVVVAIKKYEVFEVTVEVKFKLGIKNSGSIGRRNTEVYVKDLKMPTAYEILKAVERGKHFKTHTDWVFGAIMAITPFSRYWLPQAARAITDRVQKYIASKTQHYLDNVKRDFTSFDISEYVNEYGARPFKITMHKEGYMAVYVAFDKFYMLNEKVDELKEKFDIRYE